MANTISDKDVAKAKEMLKRSKQDAEKVKGLEKMKRALINDMAKDSVKKLEKSFLSDESKNLKGKAFANGGKVDFKGIF